MIFEAIVWMVLLVAIDCQPPPPDDDISRCSWTTSEVSSTCTWTSPERCADSDDEWTPDFTATPNPVKRVRDYLPVEVSSGKRMKAKALQTNNIHQALLFKCSCGRECMKTFNFNFIKTLREEFWIKSRRERMRDLKQYKNMSKKNGKFTLFFISDIGVCTRTFLSVLNINKNTLSNIGSSSKKPRDWQDSTLILLSWMEDFFRLSGERMPHRTEILLPYGTRTIDVYRRYRAETALPVSRSQFYKKWQENFPYVKARKTNSFTKCTTCVTIERQMMKTNSVELRAEYRKQKEEHNVRQMLERKFYYSKRIAAEKYPSKYMSLIIDGMDQSKTNLPHFTGRKPKNLNLAELLKTHITGVLSHGEKSFRGYVDIGEYPHDPNLIMNVLVKQLIHTATKNNNQLPPTLYLQADNCWRENKNRYFMSFLELLVKEHIFNEVHLSFLPVGHTHEDIDSQFSHISQKLRTRDAETFEDLLNIIPSAERLEMLEDFKGWLMPHISDIQHITQPLHYKFQKIDENIQVLFKGKHNDMWRQLNGQLLNNVPSGSPSILVPNYSDIDRESKLKLIHSAKCLFQKQTSITEWERFYRNLESNNDQQPIMSQLNILPRQQQQHHSFVGIGIEPEIRQMMDKENRSPQTQIRKRQRKEINEKQTNKQNKNGLQKQNENRKGPIKKIVFTSCKTVMIVFNGDLKRHVWSNVLQNVSTNNIRTRTLFLFLMLVLVLGQLTDLLVYLMNQFMILILTHCSLLPASQHETSLYNWSITAIEARGV